jgi:hypothetical protein
MSKYKPAPNKKGALGLTIGDTGDTFEWDFDLREIDTPPWSPFSWDYLQYLIL